MRKAALTIIAAVGYACSGHAQFNLSNSLVPVDQIHDGGPGKDGIPAILNPRFVPVDQVSHIQDSESVMGYISGGVAKAYPLPILVWHEIVNDTVGNQAIVVTYCPLCGTGMVFDRRAGGSTLSFGVSGLLYNSDMLMYDHQTESLWSQVMTKAISGPMAGKALTWLPSEQMTWAAWKALYPDSLVLIPPEASRRPYGRTPYAGYESSPRTMFPVPQHRTDLPLKEWVLGVVVNGLPRAYPIKLLAQLGAAADNVNGVELILTYDPTARRATVTDAATGARLPAVQAFWFAWQAFYPETEVGEIGG